MKRKRCSDFGMSFRLNFTPRFSKFWPRLFPPKKSSEQSFDHFKILGSFSINLSKARQVIKSTSGFSSSSNCRLRISARSFKLHSAKAFRKKLAFFNFDSIRKPRKSFRASKHGTEGKPAPAPRSANRAFFGKNFSAKSDSRTWRTAKTSGGDGATRCRMSLCLHMSS